MAIMVLDINSDLGEGMGNDASIMPFITSCNIACGGHAGDEYSIRSTIQLAQKYQVKIGAHPSYPDKANFGRKEMDMSPKALFDTLFHQISLVKEQLAGAALHHIKPHGALYNQAAISEQTAETIVNLVKEHFSESILYVPDGSIVAALAKHAGLKVWYEVFADRNYNDDLTLVSRKADDAVLHDKEEVMQHLRSMATSGHVKTKTGNTLPIKADTVCVHGDNPSALELAKEIFQFLKDPENPTA